MNSTYFSSPPFPLQNPLLLPKVAKMVHEANTATSQMRQTVGEADIDHPWEFIGTIVVGAFMKEFMQGNKPLKWKMKQQNQDESVVPM